jgi:hypothetical protein
MVWGHEKIFVSLSFHRSEAWQWGQAARAATWCSCRWPEVDNGPDSRGLHASERERERGEEAGMAWAR